MRERIYGGLLVRLPGNIENTKTISIGTYEDKYVFDLGDNKYPVIITYEDVLRSIVSKRLVVKEPRFKKANNENNIVCRIPCLDDLSKELILVREGNYLKIIYDNKKHKICAIKKAVNLYVVRFLDEVHVFIHRKNRVKYLFVSGKVCGRDSHTKICILGTYKDIRWVRTQEGIYVVAIDKKLHVFKNGRHLEVLDVKFSRIFSVDAIGQVVLIVGFNNSLGITETLILYLEKRDARTLVTRLHGLYRLVGVLSNDKIILQEQNSGFLFIVQPVDNTNVNIKLLFKCLHDKIFVEGEFLLCGHDLYMYNSDENVLLLHDHISEIPDALEDMYAVSDSLLIISTSKNTYMYNVPTKRSMQLGGEGFSVISIFKEFLIGACNGNIVFLPLEVISEDKILLTNEIVSSEKYLGAGFSIIESRVPIISLSYEHPPTLELQTIKIDDHRIVLGVVDVAPGSESNDYIRVKLNTLLGAISVNLYLKDIIAHNLYAKISRANAILALKNSYKASETILDVVLEVLNPYISERKLILLVSTEDNKKLYTGSIVADPLSCSTIHFRTRFMVPADIQSKHLQEVKILLLFEGRGLDEVPLRFEYLTTPLSIRDIKDLNYVNCWTTHVGLEVTIHRNFWLDSCEICYKNTCKKSRCALVDDILHVLINSDVLSLSDSTFLKINEKYRDTIIAWSLGDLSLLMKTLSPNIYIDIPPQVIIKNSTAKVLVEGDNLCCFELETLRMPGRKKSTRIIEFDKYRSSYIKDAGQVKKLNISFETNGVYEISYRYCDCRGVCRKSSSLIIVEDLELLSMPRFDPVDGSYKVCFSLRSSKGVEQAEFARIKAGETIYTYHGDVFCVPVDSILGIENIGIDIVWNSKTLSLKYYPEHIIQKLLYEATRTAQFFSKVMKYSQS